MLYCQSSERYKVYSSKKSGKVEPICVSGRLHSTGRTGHLNSRRKELSLERLWRWSTLRQQTVRCVTCDAALLLMLPPLPLSHSVDNLCVLPSLTLLILSSKCLLTGKITGRTTVSVISRCRREMSRWRRCNARNGWWLMMMSLCDLFCKWSKSNRELRSKLGTASLYRNIFDSFGPLLPSPLPFLLPICTVCIFNLCSFFDVQQLHALPNSVKQSFCVASWSSDDREKSC